MEIRIKNLNLENIDEILNIENLAFIPNIRTSRKTIIKRLNLDHTYFGVEVNNKLIGSLALRESYFKPDMDSFKAIYPSFEKYVYYNNSNLIPNAIFVYSLGILPKYRNGRFASDLLFMALKETKKRKLDFLVGDARIPSYNGSENQKKFESFKKNSDFKKEVDKYLKTKDKTHLNSLIMKDPVAGFYLRTIKNLQLLGITDSSFWKEDFPCGGHMAILYLDLKK